MKSSTFALVASLAPLILASPLHMARHAEPQEVKYVTDVVTNVATAEVTQYVTAGAPDSAVVTVTASAPASSSSSSSSSSSPAAAPVEHQKNGGNGGHHWSWSQESTAPEPTSSPAPAPIPSSTEITSIVPSVPSIAPSVPATSQAPPPPSSSPQTTPSSSPSPVKQGPFTPGPNQGTAGMTMYSYYEAVPAPTPASINQNGDESFNPVDGTLQAASLNSTNFWRKKYGAPPVVWNTTIEQESLNVNLNLSMKCDWDHSANGTGQNMAEGAGSPMSFIDGWGGEVKDMNWNDVDWNENTGHFTQLVWQDTTSIACTAIQCDGVAPPPGKGAAFGWFYRCDYYPTGNILGYFPQNVKQS